MAQDLFTFEVNPGQLSDRRDEIIELAGYSPHDCETHIRETLENLLVEANRFLHIRCGYRRFYPSDVIIKSNTIRCTDAVFECGNTIAGQLRGTSGLILFAATLGQKFDDWSRDLFSGGDPFAGYLADLIGSVRTEQAADWLEQQIMDTIAVERLCTSNRFSPGYCGWDVDEQHRLFGLLPDNFLDIHLNASALMTPVKSVSGIIGIGKSVKREPYTCKFCHKPDCYMRRPKTSRHKEEFV